MAEGHMTVLSVQAKGMTNYSARVGDVQQTQLGVQSAKPTLLACLQMPSDGHYMTRKDGYMQQVAALSNRAAAAALI
jgi:hypothetical protein